MDALMKKELEGIRNDREAGREASSQKMDSFARELMNGLGDEIEKELNNPKMNVVHSGPIYRIRKWISDRKERRKIRRYLKNSKGYGTKIQ